MTSSFSTPTAAPGTSAWRSIAATRPASTRSQKVLDGGDKLNAIEAAEIGDVRGLARRASAVPFRARFRSAWRGAAPIGHRARLLAGRDRRGARACRARLGVKARFVEGNVYDARALLDGDFDMVYVTWGAINWLPDIARWAKVVASLLKPGGFSISPKAIRRRFASTWSMDGSCRVSTGGRRRTGRSSSDEDTTYTGVTTESRQSAKL